MAARAADDKKAENVVILDMEPLTVMTDCFVICSGDSAIQVQAIATSIEEKLEQAGARKLRREGGAKAEWILLDYGSVVVHVFRKAQRDYYDLERLWGDAERLEWDEPAVAVRSGK